MAAQETEIERLLVRLVGDGSDYQKMMTQTVASTQQAMGQVQRMAGKIEAITNPLKNFAGQALSSITGLVGGVSLLGNAFKAVDLAAEAEKNEIAFGTMLKSVDLGKQMVKDLQTMGAATPMSTQDLQKAAKTLLQFGTAGEDIIPTLKMIGDATGGDAQMFSQMSLAFGQMSASGRLMGNDLFQMINAGFNPLMEISQRTGESMISLKKKMEKGQISLDMVKESFRKATSAGGQFDGLMEKQSKSISGLFSTMKDDIDSMLRTIGVELVREFRLREVMQQISKFAADATNWFKALSPEVKKAVFVAAMLAAGIGTLLAVWPMVAAVAGTILVTLGGLIGALFTPIGLVVGAVVLLGAAIVANLGGVEATFQKVLGWLQEFWEWTEPIRKAVVSLFQTVSDVASQAFTYLKGVATDAWEWIAGQADVNWAEVATTIQKALLMAEFGIKNFEQIMNYVWARGLYEFIKFTNQVEYFFDTVLPAALDWFADNWANVLVDGLDNSLKYTENYVGNIVKLITSIPGLIAGDLSVDQVLGEMKRLDDGFKSTTSKLKIPERQADQLEEQLRAEFEKQGSALGASWDEFYAAKMAEFGAEGPPPEAVENAAKTGQKIGKEIDGGVGKELKHMDAVLFGSAEALARVAEYREKILDPGTKSGDVAKDGLKQFDAAAVGSADAAGRKSEDTEVLKQIRDEIKTQGKKPSTNLAPADLEG